MRLPGTYISPAEIGLYYLQSRYYDPVVGRFVNADEPEYVSIDDTILSYNLFAYCKNSCVNTEDPTGHGPVLAIGIQLAFTVGKFVLGLEVLWDTSKWKCYFFLFIGGGSKTFLEGIEEALMEDLTYVLKKVPNLKSATPTCLQKFGISLSFIVVLGNKYASFPENYKGWFASMSVSFRNVTIGGAIWKSGKLVIGSFNIGGTTKGLGFGFSQTYYMLINKDSFIEDLVEPLRNIKDNQRGWLAMAGFLLL